MPDDERAIRELIENWIAASRAGDLAKVLTLMADDVVFMVPGQEPFGKDMFAARSREMHEARLEAESEIKEIAVAGDWAWCRTHLAVSIIPPGGKTTRKAGYTLSIFRKKPDGGWVLARDANLLMAE